MFKFFRLCSRRVLRRDRSTNTSMYRGVMEKEKSKATSLGGNLKWLNAILAVTSSLGREGVIQSDMIHIVIGHPHTIPLSKEDVV